MKVLWLHNNPGRQSGTFMWDILDRMAAVRPSLTILDRAIPLMRRRGALRDAIRLSATRDGWDVVHAQYGALVGLLGSRSGRAARVVSLRGSDIYWRYGTLRNRVAGLLRVGMSWIACIRADRVIVMSRRMMKRVGAWPGVDGRKLILLPDPAGEMFWDPSVRSVCDQITAARYAMMIASIEPGNPIKRTGLVVDAAALCRDAGLNVDVTVLSAVPREQVRDTIAQADCVALASTHEGWPNIVKEGLLLGKPFIATDVGDLAGYAGPSTANMIVQATPLAFAHAVIDQIAARILVPHAIPPTLVQFHPDVVALKMHLVYLDAKSARR